DGLCLDLSETESLHEAGAGRIGIGGIANQRDDFVEVVKSNQVSSQYVSPPFCFGQLELCTPYHYIVAVVNVTLDEVFEIERKRPALDQCNIVSAEGRLKGRILVKVVQDDISDGIFLQVVDDAEPFAVRLIADV